MSSSSYKPVAPKSRVIMDDTGRQNQVWSFCEFYQCTDYFYLCILPLEEREGGREGALGSST